jgi:hypothetical protein
MLSMRQEQLDAFQKVAEDNFQEAVAAYLGERFPEKFAQQPRDWQMKFIATSLARAAVYGLENEVDLVRFTEAGIRLGIGFDTAADCWAAAVMQNTSLGSATERIGYIANQLGPTVEE